MQQQRSLSEEFAARCRLYEIDDDVLHLGRSLAPAVRDDMDRVFDALVARVDADPFYRRSIAGIIGDIRPHAEDHFRKLFADGFDEAYFERLAQLGRRELQTGVGMRLRLAFGMSLMSHLFALSAGRLPGTGAHTARSCTRIMRLVLMDVLNGLGLEQIEMRSSMKQREAALEAAIAAFSESVGQTLTTVASAGEQLQAGATSTIATSSLAGQEAGASETACQEVGASIKGTAEATHTLAQSIGEISRHSQTLLSHMSSVAGAASDAEGQLAGLTQAADEIGSVMTLISDIAQKTNLLALNATIEAARAGEAGRGFAVVAAEVKSLAMQTAKATEDIARKIAAIQSSTSLSSERIASITRSVQDASGITSVIADAVQEQSEVTRQIAAQADLVSAQTSTIAGSGRRVREAASDSERTAGEIAQLAHALITRTDAFRGNVDEFVKAVRST